jgi:hypothetical protein
MFKLKRLRAPIYVIFVISTIPLWSDGVGLNTTNTKEIRLSPKYKNYVNVFSKEEALKFLNFTRVEHSILIEEGVEVSYNPIY